MLEDLYHTSHPWQSVLERQPQPVSDDRISPDELPEFDLQNATKDYVFDLIAAAYQIKNPSPEFLDEVTDSMSCPRFDWHENQLPECQIIHHIPGVNDTMSGGLHETDRRKRRLSDSATVCSDTPNSQVGHMPHRLINREDISSYNLFRDPRYISEIPEDVWTTPWGLSRAYHEVQTNHLFSLNFDELLLGAIAKRAGRVDYQELARLERYVFYPEDIVPCVQPLPGNDLFDYGFWEQMSAQGDIWSELSLFD